jgi:pSer/pThr/pTyr-binding forkhead associated (FHA) protein
VKRLPPHLRSVSPAELGERLAAERRGAPFLLYLDGDARQRIVDLAPGRAPLSIGRDAVSDIPLAWDSEVSRAHAVLERIGGAWTLVDDGLSRNGSSVNGRRVHGRRRLDSGDMIDVGRTQLVYVAGPEKANTTATSHRGSPPELTPAQRRVLHALCAPLLEDRFAAPPSNREIAAELFLGVETVKSHLHALFEVFGVGDMPQNRKRAELARLACECGAAFEPSRSR